MVVKTREMLTQNNRIKGALSGFGMVARGSTAIDREREFQPLSWRHHNNGR
jgi:hypothetical protein